MISENFLDDRFSIFTDAAIEASGRGAFVRAEPFLHEIDRAFLVTRGMREIMNITRANLIRETVYCAGSNAGLEPPLNRASIEALLGLGVAVSEMFEESLEDTAAWVERQADSAGETGAKRSDG
ncbi:hypothetical protein [Paraburkholderia lycopersici]|uniref:Uncharacterized protein n=1 Tax=Paraburkholderia lycopersici TaxID=416944 RepID=A0A1G6K4E7_9BURK|nr:hypothetical protein [Paraburkholderia lycopersici]SDC25721.1 hypothetical protein SAMN05421548_10591 [Paraburkholderia lycopersici]